MFLSLIPFMEQTEKRP